MEYDPSFVQEEVRCGFTVTEKRKKVWHVELELLKKFDEVCKKHHLSYYAYYGTLLGAVRHQGFIPWDDDIDVMMFRDDYAKLKKVAKEEFTEPYLYQDSYNGQQIWCISKIRDSRTTAIEFPDAGPEFNQGIYIDIFPFDDALDDDISSTMLAEMKREIWTSIAEPELLLSHLQKGTKFMLDAAILYDLLSLPMRQRFQEFEDFNLSNFGKSKNVDFISRTMSYMQPTNRKRSWYEKTVCLPFENIAVPAPAEYGAVLESHYGGAQSPGGGYKVHQRFGSTHDGIFLDPDVPYTYYLQHRDEMERKY